MRKRWEGRGRGRCRRVNVSMQEREDGELRGESGGRRRRRRGGEEGGGGGGEEERRGGEEGRRRFRKVNTCQYWREREGRMGGRGDNKSVVCSQCFINQHVDLKYHLCMLYLHCGSTALGSVGCKSDLNLKCS